MNISKELSFITLNDINYRSTCLPVHLAADSSLDSYSNSCGLDCTDRRVRAMSFPLEFTIAQTQQAQKTDMSIFTVNSIAVAVAVYTGNSC